MDGAVRGFWVGALLTAALFAATGGTTVDLRVSGTDAGGAQLGQAIDQSALSGLLVPAAPPLGTLHIRKRTWGIVSTYSETLAAPAAQAAGLPPIRVVLTAPGAVTVTNAPGRDGRALVWTGLPDPGPAWAETRAINWPVALCAAVAAAGSLWRRWRQP
jgi:hypothetical protein